MNTFDRDFLGTLLSDENDVSVEALVQIVPDSDLEKIAFLTPRMAAGLRRTVGSGMQGLTATVPVKTLATGAGAIYGGMQDPGYDPMTGQQNSRLGNIALGAAGGLAAGAGLQRGARAALGMQGQTGDYLRKAMTNAARRTTNTADRGLAIDQLKGAYKQVGQSMPRIQKNPVAGAGKKFDMTGLEKVPEEERNRRVAEWMKSNSTAGAGQVQAPVEVAAPVAPASTAAPATPAAPAGAQPNLLEDFRASEWGGDRNIGTSFVVPGRAVYRRSL